MNSDQRTLTSVEHRRDEPVRHDSSGGELVLARSLRTGTLHLLLGLAILVTGLWGLWRDVAPISTMFYVPAWWGLIFAADGFCALRRGSSLLTTRRWHL